MADLELARPMTAPEPTEAARRPPSLAAIVGWLALGAVLLVAFLLRPPYLGGTTNWFFVYGVSMEPTMHTGDLVVFVPADEYAIGDIVAYHPVQAPDAVIIHRIVDGNATDGFVVEGDDRTTSDLDTPTPDQLLGKALFWIPNAGWFLTGIRLPLIFGGLVALLLVYLVWDKVPGFRRKRSA